MHRRFDFFAIVCDITKSCSHVHQAHFSLTRVNRARALSLASCVRSHDISSPEADALWPRLTPLGDTGLHRPTCVFTYDDTTTEARFFLLCARGNAREIKSVATEMLHVREVYSGLEYRDDSSCGSARLIARLSLLPRRNSNDVTIHYYLVSYLLQGIPLPGTGIHRILHF